MFDAAVESAQPSHALPPLLPQAPPGRTIVVGAGKASAAMARALETHWPHSLSGLVVTRYGHAVDCDRIEIVEAAHPVPDDAGIDAARRILASVRGLTRDDLVVALISGGGSSLLTLPLPGAALADKQAINRALLASGASISEINCVRRHLSAIKGGRLAAACHPARVITLAISDVPGDDPIDIASGPTVADPTTVDDAQAVLRKYAVEPTAALLKVLASDAAESVKPGDPRLARAEYRLIATPQKALEAAARVAREAGIAPLILSDRIEGEARDVGKALAAIALQATTHGQPIAPPCVLLSGGETTVTVRSEGGRGGRNVECLLALTVALAGRTNVYALAADTDGVDGTEEIAGAIATPDTVARARERGRSAAADLARHDAHAFFEAIGDSIVTGPTRTNVNDFRAILVIQQAGNELQRRAWSLTRSRATRQA
ncbi:MAG TPA: glycerate kinase [Casimicrobiaceae bacterium]|nr:glycerate kinase [Casimicrobiaceae bacterium]